LLVVAAAAGGGLGAVLTWFAMRLSGAS